MSSDAAVSGPGHDCGSSRVCQAGCFSDIKRTLAGIMVEKRNCAVRCIIKDNAS